MMDKLFKLARELATPQIWSAGVEIARNAHIQEDRPTGDGERVFRLATGPRDKVMTITLSEEQELWQCSCASDDDPCKHVIGTILAVRQGNVEKHTVRSSRLSGGQIQHHFSRRGDLLEFSRTITWGEEVVDVPGTLTATVVEQTKKGRTVIVSDEEQAIDYVLPNKKAGIFEPKTMRFLLAALSRLTSVQLDGVAVRVSPLKQRAAIEVVDEGEGFRIRRALVEGASEIFRNGAALIDGEIVFIDDSALTAAEFQMLEGEGAFVPTFRAIELASVVIPALQKKVDVTILSDNLPRARELRPRVYIETNTDETGTELLVVPHLVYGDPVIAEVNGDALSVRGRFDVPVRDRAEETQLLRQLQSTLQLRLNEARVFRGEDAARFSERLASWPVVARSGRPLGSPERLLPAISFTDTGPAIALRAPDGRTFSLTSALSAFGSGGSFVQLEGGGWGALPKEWLREHEDALRRLLAAKGEKSIEAKLLPEIEEICASVGADLPPQLEALRAVLRREHDLPEVTLPSDLTVTLRSYQTEGVRWLVHLRSIGLSALLADDMGLGKTLQALCAVSGRTLVIAPASVIHTWKTQVERFRPSLTASVFHGPSRKLNRDADITITTYALARIDNELLTSEPWDTIVLDEAQTIRNPESQVSLAIKRFSAPFKLNLSGTPVENSLSDLWSQFSFLIPGLLGSRADFKELASRIAGGDHQAAIRLQTRVRPFIMRRLKRDVAQELPPKTEETLFCDLSYEERVVYEAILGSARAELLAKLEDGAGLFSTLEALLRLRQSCCHAALLPGQNHNRSSKVELLVERLLISISQGHRALVFSQWTSLLDLIEPRLREAGISFSRIDGSTTDREAVVRAFQDDPDGPRVMLLSLKAGGVGLTLTAADHVYIMDPWWNPAVEDQAADRVYRIGQENPVMVYRLVARDTVEERVLDLQARKRGLLESALGSPQGAATTALRDDLVALLGASESA